MALGNATRGGECIVAVSRECRVSSCMEESVNLLYVPVEVPVRKQSYSTTPLPDAVTIHTRARGY